jgi:hypothetical protein
MWHLYPINLMFTHKAETAVVLGAGFSRAAGLPLQNELADALLSSEFDSAVDLAITAALKQFLIETFAWTSAMPLPSLEDIFTMIDLSAGSGHHLGRKFTPKLLRALRRMLIFRVFKILDRRFRAAPEIDAFLKKYLVDDKPISTHFIVLNWDIVLERHLERHDPNLGLDYCSYALPWLPEDYEYPRTVGIVKVHGSSNWVYCDNCRALFYDRYRKLSLTVRAGLIKADFRLFDAKLTDREFDSAVGIAARERNCRRCRTAVGPHIATFSYKKSFRTHAFASSWLAAEQILTDANRWIFIGYSLPEADYEFKHLLKTSQLKLARSKTISKSIDVVLLNDTTAADKYTKFFGLPGLSICQTGLAGYMGM